MAGCIGSTFGATPEEPDLPYSSSDLVISGTIITMDDQFQVLHGGRLVIQNGRILEILSAEEPIPPVAVRFPSVEVSGFVFPGLINAHNHLSFNALPDWPVPQFGEKPLNEVYQWREGQGEHRHIGETYRRGVTRPRTGLMSMGMADEVGQWAELKELVSGTTTSQGSFGFRHGRGPEQHGSISSRLIRNLDLEEPATRQTVSGVFEEDRSTLRQEYLSGVAEDLASGESAAFLIHLSEGTTEASRQEFDVLNDFSRDEGAACGPLMRGTAIIHGLPYAASEFQVMAQCDTSLIASPLGNLLYYGRFPDLASAAKLGVNVAISTDWSVVGSKNLLEELKVADYLNRHAFTAPLDDRELVGMVTSNPARAVGRQYRSGRLAQGFDGDLLVIEADTRLDPYRVLIEATEEQVALVVVGGDPVYGDEELMARLKPDDYEVIDSECEFTKAVDFSPGHSPRDTEFKEYREIKKELGRSFRRDPSLRRMQPSPLFNCADPGHWEALAESNNLSYYHPELAGLAEYVASFYRPSD